MRFDLVRPCPKCPFRTDCLEGWLQRRATEIAGQIGDEGRTFSCHETVEHLDDDEDGEQRHGGDEQHCAGAAILQEKLGKPGQMLRIAERLGIYDHTKLDMKAPVFDCFEDFIAHHMKGTRHALPRS